VNGARVLVVDDEPQILRALEITLRREGYEVDTARTAGEALSAAAARPPEAVILDLLLPDGSGTSVCRELREWSAVPILVLSAVEEEAEKVAALDAGADDYVTKPFSPRELLARVQASIRRSRRSSLRPCVAFGDVQVDFACMRATRSGKAITLTAHEFKLLRFFLDNPERVLSRDELLNEVWGYNAYPSTRTVDNQILKLRQKLEENPANPVHFCTVHGAGYRFVQLPLPQ